MGLFEKELGKLEAVENCGNRTSELRNESLASRRRTAARDILKDEKWYKQGWRVWLV